MYLPIDKTLFIQYNNCIKIDKEERQWTMNRIILCTRLQNQL